MITWMRIARFSGPGNSIHFIIMNISQESSTGDVPITLLGM